MEPKPIVHCFAAYTLEDGEVWGTVHRVSLETAAWMQHVGYVIIGPDPHDMIALTKWERDNALRGLP